ncbi:MAG: energy transducer TonB [Verrucomicrobiota bacterium]|nr:energy transducer TonB [Verrucomicrobiota bacterium]
MRPLRNSILLILLIQLVLVWVFSEPEDSQSSRGKEISTVYHMPPTGTAVSSSLLEAPLVFAAPHPQGFSGAAWMKLPAIKAPVRAATNNMQFTSYREAGHGSISVVFPGNDLLPPARSAMPMVSWSPEVPDSTPKSILTIHSAFAPRLRTVPELPPQVHTDVLSNSVVQVGLDPRGRVVSSRILVGSGSRQADLDALRIARQLSYTPSAEHELQWGELTFQWASLPSLPTNSPAPAQK